MKDAKKIFFTVGPSTLYLFFLFLVPLLLIFVYAFLSRSADGEMQFAFTLENFGRVFNPLFLHIFIRSVRLAALTTVISLLIGYPSAWAISRMKGHKQLVFLMLIIIPSWMNLLIKNYAWIVILRREGFINTVLKALGLIHQPLGLLFSEGAVLVGLIHTFLPFMVLPVFASLERLDKSMLEAARDLGAGKFQRFRKVILPQSISGVLVGSILVFIPTLGAFVTPDLLGGANEMMAANLIQNQVLMTRDWPFASAISIILMSIVLLALMLYIHFTGQVGEERVL
jgi:spermidine/putrescine transport system permease protein